MRAFRTTLTHCEARSASGPVPLPPETSARRRGRVRKAGPAADRKAAMARNFVPAVWPGVAAAKGAA
jgi:hypothetical protein